MTRGVVRRRPIVVAFCTAPSAARASTKYASSSRAPRYTSVMNALTCATTSSARKSTPSRRPRACRSRTRSEEHTSELQSLMRISYAVFCLKKKKKQTTHRLYQDNQIHRNNQQLVTRCQTATQAIKKHIHNPLNHDNYNTCRLDKITLHHSEII